MNKFFLFLSIFIINQENIHFYFKLYQKNISKRHMTSLIQYICSRCILKSLINLVNKNAQQEAKLVDKLLSGSTLDDKYSEENAPLLGVPFSCKEWFWVKDMPNTTGTLYRQDFRAPRDADVVQYMRQAGAIMTCLTNTSELCMWMESVCIISHKDIYEDEAFKNTCIACLTSL